jgi:hypothetical protein
MERPNAETQKEASDERRRGTTNPLQLFGLRKEELVLLAKVEILCLEGLDHVLCKQERWTDKCLELLGNDIVKQESGGRNVPGSP